MIDDWISIIRRTEPVKRGLLGSKDSREDMDAVREQVTRIRKLCLKLRDVLSAAALKGDLRTFLEIKIVDLCLSTDQPTRADLLECHKLANIIDLTTLPFETCDASQRQTGSVVGVAG